MMIAQQQEEPDEPAVTALFCWGLGTAEPLRRLWLEQTQEKKREDEVKSAKAGPFDNLLLLKSQQERCVCVCACVVSSLVSPVLFITDWRQDGQSTNRAC